MASKRIDLTINGKNNAKAALQSASNDVKKLSNDVKSTSSKMTMASGFNKIVSEARTASIKIREFFNSLGGAISSAFAGFSLATIMQDAGEAESKWNRIAAETEATGENLKAQKVTIRSIADTYGVVNGTLSGIYETNLRFFGDQERSLLITKGIAATNKRTGTDMETIQQALLSGELGRNKALQRSVLTEAQRKKYLEDGKLSQEEINQLMQENIEFTEQNAALTADAESAYARMQSSLDSMVITIGSDLAPVITSMAGVITTIADKFKIFDKASGGILGSVTGVLLAVIALGAPLAWAGGILVNMARSAAATAASLTEAAIASKNVSGGGAAGAAGGVGSVLKYGAIAAGFVAIGMAVTDMWDAASQGAIKFFSTANFLSKDENGIWQEQTWKSPIPAINDFTDNASKSLRDISKKAGQAGDSLRNSFSKAAGGVSGSFKWIRSSAQGAINWIKGAWKNTVSWIRNGMSAAAGAVAGSWSWISSAARGAINSVLSAWNNLKGNVRRGVSGAVSIFSNGLSSVWGAVSGLYNMVRNGAQGVVSIVQRIIGGPGGPAPRGPSGPLDDMNFNYENYGGWKKNAWTGSNSMSGNCADMTTGLIGRFGGSMVEGTWNGNPHVWWKSPDGKEYDPARKALNNTFSPPPRGPNGASGNIIINGDVYGYDDFQKKVQMANDRMTSRVF